MFTKTHVTNNTQKCYKNGTYKVRYEDGEESKGNISVMILFKVTYFLGMCITVVAYAMILSPLPVSSVPTNITFADGTGIVKSDLRLFSEPSKAEAPGDRIAVRVGGGGCMRACPGIHVAEFRYIYIRSS